MKKSVRYFLVFLLITAISGACRNKPENNAAVMISENGRYFVKDGKPFFWQGDTDWELFRVYTVPEAKTILQKRKEQGFTIIQAMTVGVFPEAAAIVKMKSIQGLQAWLDWNPLTPNEKYFNRMDSIVAVADQLDIVLVVGVYHAWDQDRGRITVKNARPWAKWLTSRYKNARNVIWAMYPHAKQASDSVVMATVQGIKEGDDGRHLITIHPDPGPVSSSIMHSQPWLSFNTIQTWTSNFTNYDMVAKDYAKMPVKPVVDGEARYEGEDKTTPFETRRVAYWTCLAGGFYSYGHAGNWLYPLTWKDWIDSPGAKQMKTVRDVFESLDWWNLVPDQSILSGEVKGNAAARSAKGDWIMVYITGKDAVSLKLDKINAKLVKGYRINPQTGAKTEWGTINTSATTAFLLPDGLEDAILIFKK
jgi:hypothetical protein